MAYSITYGCINSPGSSSDYITSGPYLAGAIRFTASRNAVNDPNVKVICDIYAGFGSYSNFGSYISTPIYARPWYGSTSYSTASHSLNIAMNSGTWSRTSNTSQRLSTLGGLTATGYPTITSSTNQVLCNSINWTSGTKTFFIYFAGADGYQAKSVSVACPAYHADVTISYNANGGTGAPSSQTKIYGTNLTLRDTSPSRTGYTFKGWASSNTATTAEWQPGGILSAEGARTLYAIWEAKTYTVVYNGNGATSGSMANSTATYNQNFITRENAFIKTGYTFNGWKSKSNPSETQYTSEDWGLNAPGVYESGSSQKWSITGDRYLYAQWNINSYTLTVNAGEGIIPNTSGWTVNGNIATKTILYNNTFGTLPTPTRAGYTFLGWFTAELDGTKVTSDTRIGATDTNIYAHWNRAQYTVHYDINKGSGTISPDTVTFAPTVSITLNSTNGLTKQGFTASGWNTAEGTNQSANTHFDSGAAFNASSTTFDSDNKVTLYVHWVGAQYTISYNANGGSGAPASQPGNYGTSLTIQTTIPTRTNYYFKGWNTKQDGSGDTYQPGETYNKYLTVTLYAQWESNNFSIAFDSNYLQDYNVTRNQVAFGIESRDNAFNSHSALSQGLYTTGIYVKSAILDNYGTGVLSGQLMASTLERALYKASYSSGILGSINLSSAYTKDSITIPSSWYNYIYVPHRTGGNGGAAQSDNHNYGTMIITGMTSDNGIYKIRYNSGIESIEKFYTTLNKPTASDINAVPTTRTVNSKALSANITLSASDVGALANTGGQVSGDITLYKASGDSPSLIFQRGTLTDNYNDWRIYNTGGYLHFQQRGQNSTDWTDIAYIGSNGIIYGNGSGLSGIPAVGDTAWKTLETNFNYIKRDGVVYVDFYKTNQSLSTSWTTIGTLPSGYRPNHNLYGAAMSLTTTPIAYFINSSSGVVQMRTATGSGSYVTAFSVSYPVL